MARNQALVLRRFLNVRVQHDQRSSRHGLLFDERPEHRVHRLAQFNRGSQRALSLFRKLHARGQQTIDLQIFQQASVFAEARQIDIALQQFFGLVAETIIERVDEVQTYCSRDQFESRRPSASFGLR